MSTIIKHYHEPFYSSKILNFYLEDFSIGVIDIETTGLSPDRSEFILGGLVVPEFGEKKLIQFFSESKAQEAAILEAYIAELQKLDVLISYNGDSFDLPFLKKRLLHHGIIERRPGDNDRADFPACISFDLYRAIDRHSSLRKLLPNLKQKTVETFMGLWSDRKDEISGAESVELYLRYLGTKNPELREIILLHNEDDLLQLSRLIQIVEKLDLHKIMFYHGFTVSSGEKKAYIKNIFLKKDSLIATGNLRNISMDYRCYQTGYHGTLSSGRRTFSIQVPWKEKKGFHYIDLQDFSINANAFEKFPTLQSGYLLLKDTSEIHYAEINLLIKLILKEILLEL